MRNLQLRLIINYREYNSVCHAKANSGLFGIDLENISLNFCKFTKYSFKKMLIIRILVLFDISNTLFLKKGIARLQLGFSW